MCLVIKLKRIDENGKKLDLNKCECGEKFNWHDIMFDVSECECGRKFKFVYESEKIEE